MKVAELFVELRVDDQGSKKKIDDVGEATKGAGVKAVALGGILADLARRLIDVGLAAAKAAVGFAVDMVKGTAAAGDEIAKTSKQLGVAATDLQRVRFAAQRSGASVASTTKAIRAMTVGLEDAATKGTGPMAEGLEAIGLNAEELEGLGLEERFSVISEALNRVGDDSRRSGLAMKIFGARAGAELKPLLDEGAAGMAALGDEAERLGGVMGEDSLADAEAFEDAMLDLRTVFDGVVRTVGSTLIPMFRNGIQTVTEWAAENRELIAVRVEEFFDRVVEVGRDLIPILVQLFGWFGKLVEVVSGTSGVTVAILALGVAVGGLPGIVFAAGAALGTFLADVLADLTGLNEEIEKTRRMKAENEELEKKSGKVERGTKAIRQIIDGTEGLSAEKFEDVKEEARQAADIGGAETRRVLESQIAAEEKARNQRSEEEAFLGFNAFLEGQVAVQGASKRAKDKRRGAGKAKAKKEEEPITGIPEIDNVLRAEEAAGEINLSAGGGARPGIATTINRVDQSFSSPISVTVEVDAEDLPEGDADAMGQQIGEAVGRVLDERNRVAADHFRSIVRI